MERRERGKGEWLINTVSKTNAEKEECHLQLLSPAEEFQQSAA